MELPAMQTHERNPAVRVQLSHSYRCQSFRCLWSERNFSFSLNTIKQYCGNFRVKIGQILGGYWPWKLVILLFRLSNFYFKMQKWFIFKNRGCGSIWSTSCFLSCPQTRAVKTFLWNMWQADMQRLSVTGAQRTQVQILPYLNSCGALCQRMKWHWFKTIVSLNTDVFTLLDWNDPLQRRTCVGCWTSQPSDGWALSSTLGAGSEQQGPRPFGAIKVLTTWHSPALSLCSGLE